MTSKRLSDIDVDELSDNELDALLNDSSTIIYATEGGMMIVCIDGEGITPKFAADALRAMAQGIEKNGIPQTLTEMRCSLLN
jgi:hypothetical protein